MAFGTKGDIETIVDDDERMAWPNTAQVCTRFDVSRPALENLVRRGQVEYVYDEKKERHFDPESVKEAVGIVTLTEAEIQGDLTKSTFELLAKTNKDLSKANSELLKLATEPAYRVIDSLQKENQDLRAECGALRQKYIDGLEAFEGALNESHARELARASAMANEARKDKGFDTLLGQVPNLLSQLTMKKAAVGLFSSLSDAQKAVLFELLSPDQLQVVLKMMGQTQSNGSSQPKTTGAEFEWSDDKPPQKESDVQ